MSDINGKKESEKEARCPQCGELMADMGLDFAAPRKDDTKAWTHLRDLYTTGFTFHSCGCGGAGFIPKDPQALYEYLTGVRNTFARNLQFWRDKENSKQSTSEYPGIQTTARPPERIAISSNNQEAIDYWISRLTAIDERIKILPAKKITATAKAGARR
jgi:hypothetical protein